MQELVNHSTLSLTLWGNKRPLLFRGLTETLLMIFASPYKGIYPFCYGSNWRLYRGVLQDIILRIILLFTGYPLRRIYGGEYIGESDKTFCPIKETDLPKTTCESSTLFNYMSSLSLCIGRQDSLELSSLELALSLSLKYQCCNTPPPFLLSQVLVL